MGEVNAAEKIGCQRKTSGLRRHPKVNSRLSKIRRIFGLQRADPRTERLSRDGVLAEGEELSSNPLFCYFKGL
jgi:hypothetical protein